MSEVDRPRPGAVEERTAGGLGADGRKIRGIVPYGVKSQDQGGWDEVIEATAFRNTKFDELRATVDHVGVPLGRYPTTLEIEDRADGLHWSLDPPASRQDVVEAVSRGDMRAGSWRMVVGCDEWRGNTRHIHEIAELQRRLYRRRQGSGLSGRGGRAADPAGPRRGRLGQRQQRRR